MSRLDYLSDVYGERLVSAIEYSVYVPQGLDITDSKEVLGYLSSIIDSKKLQWVVMRLIDRDIRLEDIDRVCEVLQSFDRVKGRLMYKDINKYRKLSDLEDEIASLEGEVLSKRQVDRITKLQGAEYIVDSDLKVLWVKTVDAAKLYGSGTRWCTAGRNSNIFDMYNRQGEVYIIIAGDRKFQFHYQSSQFMNERDVAVTVRDKQYLSLFDGWRIFLDIMIEKYYGCYFGDCGESI